MNNTTFKQCNNWIELLHQVGRFYEPFVVEIVPPVSFWELTTSIVYQHIPAHYVDFLKHTNGISLFSGLYDFYGIERLNGLTQHATLEFLQGQYSNSKDKVQPSKNEKIFESIHFFDGWFLIGNHPLGEYWMDKEGQIHGYFSKEEGRLLLAKNFFDFFRIILDRESLVFDSAGEYRDVFGQEGDFVKKIKTLRRNVVGEYDLETPWALYEEALEYNTKKQLARKADCLKGALNFDTTSGLLLELLADVNRQMGDTQSAFTYYKQAALYSLSGTQQHRRLYQGLSLVQPLDNKALLSEIEVEFPLYTKFLMDEAQRARKNIDIKKIEQCINQLEAFSQIMQSVIKDDSYRELSQMLIELRHFIRQKNRFNVL